MRKVLGCLVLGLLAASPAMAQEVTPWSGEVALTYGRNLGQGLNVAGAIFEVKYNVHPQVSVGGRFGGLIGAGVGSDSAKAYLGAPLLLKGEGFLNTERTRPFVGLGAGISWVNAAGAVVVPGSASASAYGVSAVMPTIMPELGIDLGGFRLSIHHSMLLGSARGIAADVSASGTSVGTQGIPGLSGTALQIGAHIGGVKK